MPYGKTHKLLSEHLDDTVLIESPFEEITREGTQCRSVLLALTKNKFVVVVRRKVQSNPKLYYNRIESEHPLEEVHLSIFKKSHKQILKACFPGRIVKYFELGAFNKRKIFWDLWRNHVKELKKDFKIWPFTLTPLITSMYDDGIPNDYDETPSGVGDSKEEEVPKYELKWTNKNLYLGSKREAEDKIRPQPIPGLGRPEDIQLFYLKPEYFGCWDQAEHWVQCGESTLDTNRDTNVYTYTGEPTSNITYTSIITTWK
ncbi:uncharacterized protein LOC126366434 [Pectinophora gossypiella]|uniref:uncharacterized protein LOC126366434 n=1 Tax=Pectinophora gossypiella TaxID=13191 RepID=UPI00214F3DF8|nr:uncharacterized protein LOC126366434 [Pectinophora gossypiella]